MELGMMKRFEILDHTADIGIIVHDVENLLFKGFKVDSVGEDGLKATVKGEPFQEGVHVIKTGVKAVTYHQIEVRQKNGLWRAQVILDL
jgi:SHS2 domain-containing protein